MKKIVSVLVLILIVVTINAQKTKKGNKEKQVEVVDKDPVLIKIGGKDVMLSEFNAIFNKNSNNKNVTDESIHEYLDLYIKFKLKVREAEDLGYDTLPKFINELKGYRKQLAQPYLTDKEVTEGLIKEAYERMKQDVKASHILISVDEDAVPSDTVAAYNKALEARKRIIAGESFDKVAKEFSSDPSAQKNGGDLGYFSAMHMVYPFETAAYNTKTGDVSMPIRTRFGYHVIKVVDKRPARGTIKVAHIMVKADRNLTGDAVAAKKQMIDEIYEKVSKEGQDFALIAKQYSEDQGSGKRGGELPEFNAGKMVAEFETASFALAKDGDISKPIQTDFGWHIIKRLGLKELAPYDELYNTIKAQIARDSRSNKSKEALLKKIKGDNGFVENISELKDFYKLITKEEYVKGTFKANTTSKYNKLMFGFYAKDGDKMEYNQTDFASFMETIKYRNDKKTPDFNIVSEINRLYNQIVESKAIEFKDSRLGKTNIEFKLLMQEYRDGILLFDLTDEKVWSKAVKDTSGLEAYYNQNKNSYMWGERVDAVIYTCSNEAIAKNLEKILKKKVSKGYSNDDILKMVNTDSQLNLKIEEGKFSKGDNEEVDKATWEKGSRSKLNKNESIVIVDVKNVLGAEPKHLSEIKGLITSDYQNHLEQEWVIELKSKYEVVVNAEVLKLVK